MVRPPAVSGNATMVRPPIWRSWLNSGAESAASAWMANGRPSRNTARRTGESATSIGTSVAATLAPVAPPAPDAPGVVAAKPSRCRTRSTVEPSSQREMTAASMRVARRIRSARSLASCISSEADPAASLTSSSAASSWTS
jgi:hypothetical protein